jgi:DNA-3-methyladenine glycosylase
MTYNAINLSDRNFNVAIINQNFYAQPTLIVARNLLGQRLVREINGQHLSAQIVEIEAYIGPTDTACHASKGRTPRTEVMFGPPGRAYVYLVYGMHSMLNLVTEAKDFPAAVLIRAVIPLEGIEIMQVNRHLKNPRLENLTNGPGKLCQALAIDRALNNWDVTRGQKLWIEPDEFIADDLIITGPRIGIDYALPKDREAPWRFWIAGNGFVSQRLST